jgi:hypothetical protein
LTERYGFRDTPAMGLREVAITGGEPAELYGRPCLAFGEDAPVIVPQGDLELRDGSVELELAVGGERSFPGVAWRVNGETYESFFIRPHQRGNPDACQYTPVFNGLSGWQLYHGSGYWAPIDFPLDRWFKLRVSFHGDRAEAYVDDMSRPALVMARLRAPLITGGVGILPGGGVHVARFSCDATTPQLRGPLPPAEERTLGTVPGWWVSNIVAEGALPSAARTWTYLAAEPAGLANLARVHPLGQTLNTAFARATVHAAAGGRRVLEFGFSDRVVVYLNGRPLFAGRDDYRSRDYRFLGSIGWWDTLVVELDAGDNELLMAVSETFGGWGVQARFADPGGLSFS